MFAFPLVLVLTSAMAADLSPQQLIDRLDSPDRVVREEAARTLEERSVEALPALRAAHEAAKQPEARERLAGLIARVEARLLDRPTMVASDFDDRTLGDAVQTLATRSGFSLTLDDPTLAGRRVTVRAESPLPFWQALDQLGRAGHIRHDPGLRYQARGNVPPASTLRLVDGDPPAPAAYSGPLRIHLFATHRHRDVTFETTDGSPPTPRNTTVTVEVQAFAEPGRFINPNGPPRLLAVDEQGRALSPQPGGRDEPPNPIPPNGLMPGQISLLHWHVPLGLPDPPVRSPLKLRGVLPVVISSRRADPLVIPMAGAAGKTFRHNGCVVRIEAVPAPGARPPAVNLSLSEDLIPADRTRISTGPETDHIGDFLRDRIEFQDAQGHPLTWQLLGAPMASASNANGELRVRTYVSGTAPPARLLVYRLHRLATEIPFEFGDIPST
jgi:hypothetical protein